MSSADENAIEARRREMLAAIRTHARLCADYTGRKEISARVIEAMAKVPRHLFVPEPMRPFAYEDAPLPIGEGKTISQPFMVALTSDLVDCGAGDRVLEIGAGLGYQAAVLAELGADVYAVEIVPALADEAGRRLSEAGRASVRLRLGDGARGWPEAAPFDAIVVSAAARRIPEPLLAQLKPGGRMAIPVGDDDEQHLCLVEKDADGRVRERPLLPVRYSPFTVSC